MPIALPEPKKPKKPKPPKHVNPDTQSEADNGVNPPPKNTGNRSPDTQERADNRPRHRNVQPWVVSRQRTLRANGFGVRVDGVWGARSQRAWLAYVAGLRANRMRSTLANRASAARRRLSADVRARARVAALRASAGARELAMQREARQALAQQATKLRYGRRTSDGIEGVRERHSKDVLKATVIHRAIEAERTQAGLKAMRLSTVNPGKMSVENLRTLLLDPHAGNFSPTNQAHVRLVQRFLKSHGVDVKVDGVYDETTHKALLKMFRMEKQREAREQKASLIDNFYKTGILHAGQKRPFWLPLSGPTPNPKELLSLLQGGGFQAAVVWKALAKQRAKPDVLYLQWRVEQLDKLAGDLSGPFAVDPDHDLLPQSDTANLLNVLHQTQNDKAARVRVAAMLRSRTFPELRRNLAQIEKWEEYQFVIESKLEAFKRFKEGGPWWDGFVDVLEYAARPGEWLRTNLVAEVMWIKDDPVGYLRMAADPTYQDEAKIKAEEYMARAQEEIDDLPWYVSLPFEIVVDPLVLAGPVAKGGLYGLKAGTALASRGAIAISRNETLTAAGRFAHALEVSGQKGLKAVESDFGVPLAKSRLTRVLADPAPNASYGLRTAAWAYRRGKMAGRTKDEFSRAAHARVQWAMRHGFKVSAAHRAALQSAENAIPQFKLTAKRTTMLLNTTDENLRASLPSVMPSLIRSLHAEQASIWLDSARSIYSTFGASLRARLFEEFRNQEIHRLAVNLARERHKAIIEAAEDASENSVKVRAMSEAKAEYERVRRAAGLWTKGSADKTIKQQVDRQVFALMDKFDQAIFPALQDSLEDLAEQAGLKLFDDLGMWVGKEGGLQGIIRRLARASFDPDDLVTVRNPMFHVPLTAAEADELIQSEVRRRQSRLAAWYAREVAAGRVPFPKEELGKRLDDIEEEIRDSFRPVKVGDKYLVRDTRETVEESGLYARHLDESLDVKIEPDEELDGWLDKLSKIAVPVGDGPVDRELGEVSWALSGGYSAGPGDLAKLDQTARRFPIPKRDTVRQAQTQAFADAVMARQIAVGRAYDEVLGQAFYQEKAKFQALLHAQTTPLRMLRWAVKAELSVWLFATLPLRMAWPVRNMVDNTVKSFIEGVHNPGAYYVESETLVNLAGHAQLATRSVFDVGLVPLREMSRVLDGVYGTRIAERLDDAYETFWMHSNSTLTDIFERHGIPIPEDALNGMAFRPFAGPTAPRILSSQKDEVAAAATRLGDDELVADAEKLIRKTADELKAERGFWEKRRDWLWEMMGERPENFSRRVLYRETYYKALKNGKPPIVAFDEAMARVEKTLFDYSKATQLEDNMRFFFPFVQYWRKNFGFWVRTAWEKPIVPLAVARIEQAREEAHADLPPWMRRYISAKEISDVVAVVPGLDWMADYIEGLDFQYDPMNYLSFSPLYRAFKGENIDLPSEDKGWRFVSDFVDAMNDWGLSLNPFVRKPLEHAGVLNHRAWQTVFPQTPMLEAFTRKFIGERYSDFIHDLDAFIGDPLFSTLDAWQNGERPSQMTEDKIDQWTMMEITNQVARGEQPDEDKARRKVEFFFLMQTLIGYFAGAYVRRATPEDIYLYKMEDAILNGERDFDSLSDEDKELFKLWRLRKVDRVQWQRYVEMLPMIRAYYSQPDYAAKERLKRLHPELLPYVEKAWGGGRFVGSSYIRDARLAQETETVMELFDLADGLELDYQTKKLAESALVTPELRSFWASNDTPKDRRDKMTRGLYFHHLSRMNSLYHAIPADDYDAKDGFLKEHPELVSWWNKNNSNSDDYKALMQHVQADLRDRYFEFAEDDDWDNANALLTAFPFMFDTFEGADYIEDRTTGRSQNQHASDFARVRQWLALYFSMTGPEQRRWLDSNAQGASAVRRYFQLYASGRRGGKGGMTEHARDYLAAKDALDHYFSLSKEARKRWLDAGSPEAETVLAYFKKYGKTNRAARAFENGALLETRNAELRDRLIFWKRYFALTPDKRPAYVMNQGEAHGIFIYGALGAKERHDREAEWLRKAFANGATRRSAHYLYVKPLLDLFFTLGREEKQLFMRANPEVAEYLDEFSRQSPTGDPKLDKLVERYFSLPSDSQARSLFLRRHPEVQHFFDEKATPAERAMRSILNVYFEIADPRERKLFLTKHPEIQDYFDKRKAERDAETMQLEAFDDSDPRLRPFFEDATIEVGGAAERKRYQLGLPRVQRGSSAEDGLTGRSSRRPL